MHNANLKNRLKYFRYISLGLLALLFLLISYIFSFSAEKQSRLRLFNKSFKLLKKDIALAIIEEDSKSIEILNRGLVTEGLVYLQIGSSDEVLSSFSQEMIPSNCHIRISKKIRYYNQVIGHVEGCIDNKSLLREAVKSPIFMLFCFTTISLIGIVQLLSLFSYKRELSQVIKFLDGWSKKQYKSFNLSNFRGINKDKLSKTMSQIIIKNVEEKIEIGRIAEIDAAIAKTT